MVATMTPVATGARARGPKCDQDAGGDARSGPEDGHTLQLGEEDEAQPRTQKIGDGGEDTDCDCDTPRLPLPIVRVPDVLVEALQHIAPPVALVTWRIGTPLRVPWQAR